MVRRGAERRLLRQAAENRRARRGGAGWVPIFDVVIFWATTCAGDNPRWWRPGVRRAPATHLLPRPSADAPTRWGFVRRGLHRRAFRRRPWRPGCGLARWQRAAPSEWRAAPGAAGARGAGAAVVVCEAIAAPEEEDELPRYAPPAEGEGDMAVHPARPRGAAFRAAARLPRVFTAFRQAVESAGSRRAPAGAADPAPWPPFDRRPCRSESRDLRAGRRRGGRSRSCAGRSPGVERAELGNRDLRRSYGAQGADALTVEIGEQASFPWWQPAFAGAACGACASGTLFRRRSAAALQGDAQRAERRRLLQQVLALVGAGRLVGAGGHAALRRHEIEQGRATEATGCGSSCCGATTSASCICSTAAVCTGRAG